LSLWRALSAVGGLTALSRLAGFVRDVVTAALLGAGVEADAFFIALRLPDLMRRLFAEGAFSAAFAPRFAAALADGGRLAALRFAEEAMAVLLAAALATVGFCLWAMPAVVGLLAPGFTAAGATETAVTFTRLTFPYLLPICLAALFGGVLNGFGRVAAFAASPIIFNLGMLAALGAAALTDAPTGIVLSAGVTLAGCLQLAWMAAALRRADAGLRLRLPRLTPGVRRLLSGLGPGALTVGVGQINLTVDMMLASLLPAGAVAALGYADRLAQLPMGIVGLALGMALLPRLAGLAAAGDGGGFADELRQGTLAALALSLPAAVGLAVIAGPIIDVLFVRGAFTADDGRLTAAVLAAYALGIPAAAVSKAVAAGFFARGDMNAPLRAALVTAAANVLFSLALMPLWGAPGIALATSLAAWVNLAWLWRAAPAGRGPSPLRPAALLTAAAGGMGAVAWGVSASLPPGAWGLAATLTVSAVVYAGLLILIAKRLK
jgi:putative peptidoglycan lipid II flippase